MFVVHGQSASIDAIVAASSAQKAVFHFRRMSRSGLHPVVTTADGQICSARLLLALSRSDASR